MEDGTVITLFSHQSKEYFPENAAGKFTSRLNAPVELDGSWDVGLTELHLTRFPRKPILVTQAEIYIGFLALPSDMKVLVPMKTALEPYHKRYFNGNTWILEESGKLFTAALSYCQKWVTNQLLNSNERAAVWIHTITPRKYLSLESIFEELTTQMNTLFNWDGTGSYATNNELSIAFKVNRASQTITVEPP